VVPDVPELLSMLPDFFLPECFCIEPDEDWSCEVALLPVDELPAVWA
jgi:hypothetical protein